MNMNKEVDFFVGKHMLKDVCPICKKKFKLNEKVVLYPIQQPKGDYFINARAISIHSRCFWKGES